MNEEDIKKQYEEYVERTKKLKGAIPCDSDSFAIARANGLIGEITVRSPRI